MLLRTGTADCRLPYLFTAEIKQFKEHITSDYTVFIAVYHGLRVNTPFEFAFLCVRPRAVFHFENP